MPQNWVEDAKALNSKSGAEPQREAAPAIEMIEREQPTFIRFVEGEVIEGVLLRVDRMMVGTPPKAANRYTLLDQQSGQLFCFLGTYDLDTKLSPHYVGHLARVIFAGENKEVQRNGRSLKLFKVFTSRLPVLKQGDPIITDDDIPF